MTRTHLALVLTLCAATVVSARQQPIRDTPSSARVGAALIAGTVHDDATPARVVRRALVTLSGTIGTRQAMTDDGGRFAFVDLPAGRYTLTAEKQAYVTAFYGSKAVGRGPGTSIALDEGQRLASVSMVLTRGAIVTGAVRDHNGVPIPGAQVHLLARTADGSRKLSSVTVGGPSIHATDDRGVYRLYGIPPGEYTLTASGSIGFGGVQLTTSADADAAARELQAARAPARTTVTPPAATPASVMRASAYYPDAIDPADAQFISFAAGEEKSGIDLRLSLTRTAGVEGTVAGLPPDMLPFALIGIANVSTGSMWSSPGAVRPQADGRFTVAALPAATYLFFGRTQPGPQQSSTSPMFWTSTEVTVAGQDVTGVVLSFQRGSTVTGRLTFTTATPPAIPRAAFVSLRPLPAISGAAVGPAVEPVSPDGTFVIRDVAPGEYRLGIAGMTGWVARSAVTSGTDALDGPLVIRGGEDVGDLSILMTDTPASISGTLFDQLGRPTPEYAVTVFSTNRAHWTEAPRRMSGVVKLGSDGRYTVAGLPPGEYYLVALIDATPAQLSDPQFLEQLAVGAVRISLGEGEQKTQDFKLGGG